MAVYGSYETVSEVARSRTTSVLRARPADGGWDLGFADLGTDASFALKVYHVRSAEDAGADETRRILARVRDQKRVADAGARHWAPILQSGHQRGEAFHVTPLFESSVDRLVHDSPVADESTLWAIIMGTLEGLSELQRILRRPHGNLKLGNLLLKRSAEIAPEDVLLTDPALDSDATIAGEVEDLYNLGEIIYRLVTGQTFPGQHTWPIKSSQHWARLGASGGAWLELCNRLLSPRAAEHWLRVDEIVEEVRDLRPRQQRSRGRRHRPGGTARARAKWVLLAALALIVGLGVFEYFRYANLWRELCQTYDGWTGAVAQRLPAHAPAVVAADPYLRQHLIPPFEQVASGELDLDPRRIARSDQPVAALAGHPPLSFEALWKTEKANWVLKSLQGHLSSDSWPALRDLTAQRERYRARGWPRLVEHATTLIDGVSIRAADRKAAEPWVDAVARLVEQQPALKRLDAARAAVGERLSRIQARGQSAPEIREKAESFANLLKLAAESDTALASGAAVETLAQQLERSEQVGAKFEELAPALAEATRRQRAYEVRNWLGPARSIARTIELARPGPDVDLQPAAQQLVALRTDLESVEAAWARIERRRRTLESSGDRILMTYRQFVAQSGLSQQSDVPALLRRLQEINDDPAWEAVARKVAAPEWGSFDVIAFARRSPTHRSFVGRSVPTAQDLYQWVAEVEGRGTPLASATNNPPLTQPVETVARTQPAPTTIASAKTQPAPATMAVATTTAPAPTTVAVAPPPTRPTRTPEQIRRETEIANFIIECRELGINAGTREIKQAWRDRCEQWAAAVMKNPASFEASREARQRLRTRLVQLDGAYRTSAAPLKLEGDAPWLKDLAARIDDAGLAKVNEHFRIALDLAMADDAKFDARMGEMVDFDEQHRAAALRLAGEVQTILRRAGEGYLPEEKTPEEVTLASAVARVRGAELVKIDAIGKVVEPLLAPLVADAGTPADPASLRQVAAAEERPLGVRLQAWSKLGGTGPVNAKTLTLDLKLAGSLLGSAQSKPLEKARLESIKSRLETDLRTRWTALLENAHDTDDVETAIATRQQISGVQVDALSARARFNLALHELRAVVSAGGSDEDLPRRIAPAVKKVRELAASLTGDGTADGAMPAPVKSLLDNLAAAEKPPAVDPAVLGPMSAAAAQAVGKRLAWSARAEDDGAVIVYRAALGPPAAAASDVQAATLVFRRVATSDAASPSYLLTTEVSMDLMDDLLVASGKWPDIRAKKFLPPYDPTRGDPRPGPRAWEWPRFGRSPGIVRSLVWLSADFIPAGIDHYPDTIGSEFNRSVIRGQGGHPSEALNPSRRQPMQYVSADAAMLVAALLGSRLPTAAEWQAAFKGDPSTTSANLRDRTWRLQLEHMQRPPLNGRARPDAGMFVPPGEKPSDAVYKARDGTEFDDGVLWFRPVPADAPTAFTDLAGNVAELVSTAAGKVGVIGGSSMSPPDRPIDQAFDLADAQLSSGFGDVGFRLAFSLPPRSLQPLKDAIAGNWYLTK